MLQIRLMGACLSIDGMKKKEERESCQQSIIWEFGRHHELNQQKEICERRKGVRTQSDEHVPSPRIAEFTAASRSGTDGLDGSQHNLAGDLVQGLVMLGMIEVKIRLEECQGDDGIKYTAPEEIPIVFDMSSDVDKRTDELRHRQQKSDTQQNVIKEFRYPGLHKLWIQK